MAFLEAGVNSEAQGEAKPIGFAPRRRGNKRELLFLSLWRIGILLSVLVLWEFASRVLIDPFWISKPSAIALKLFDWIISGFIWVHLITTLNEMLIGFVCGALAGICVGLLLGLNARVAKILDPFIVGFYSIPKIALAPLFILWFGIGLLSKVVLVTFVVFFLVFYNTFAGVVAVDKELIDVLRLMKARKHQIVMKVIVPSALIWMFTGMKVSIPYALIGAVVAEMMASNRGVGYLIQASAGQYDTTGVFAALVILVAISTALHALLKRTEDIFMRWKTNEQP